jgi:hypothetical protein
METTQQASEPPIKAPDFGEPWSPDKTWSQIICNRGSVHAMVDVFDKTPGLRDRIIACVNATAGMADPAKEIQAMRNAIEDAGRALADLVEHIRECSERHLLACDIDPHPPSVFSVYGAQAKRALAKLQPFLPKP